MIIFSLYSLTSDKINDDSCQIFSSGKPSIRYQRSQNVGADNLHKYIKLECIGEKYGHREKQKANLGRSETQIRKEFDSVTKSFLSEGKIIFSHNTI